MKCPHCKKSTDKHECKDAQKCLELVSLELLALKREIKEKEKKKKVKK